MHMTRKQWEVARLSRKAFQARLQLLAIERGLRPAELPKRYEVDKAMLAFCRRHEVSLDWLFMGSLKGLWGMTYDAQHPGLFAANCDPE